MHLPRACLAQCTGPGVNYDLAFPWVCGPRTQPGCWHLLHVYTCTHRLLEPDRQWGHSCFHVRCGARSAGVWHRTLDSMQRVGVHPYATHALPIRSDQISCPLRCSCAGRGHTWGGWSLCNRARGRLADSLRYVRLQRPPPWPEGTPELVLGKKAPCAPWRAIRPAHEQCRAAVCEQLHAPLLPFILPEGLLHARMTNGVHVYAVQYGSTAAALQ